jgi:hypothetical protein
MDRTIILVEDENQVVDCMRRLDFLKNETLIIALSPFAIYDLDRFNIPHKIVESYYNPKELHTLGMDNYLTVENLCNLMDSHIYNKYPKLNELGIRPVFFSFYNIKRLFDSVIIRLFQLSKLIESEKPAKLMVYPSKQFEVALGNSAQNLAPNNDESIYSQILKLQGWDVDVTILECISCQDKPHENKTELNLIQRKKLQLGKSLQKNPVIYDLAVTYRKLGWRVLLSIIKDHVVTLKGDPVLLYGGGYNWDYCKEQLKEQGIYPMIRVLSDPSSRMDDIPEKEFKKGSAVWREIKNDKKLRELFVWEHIDFFPVLEEKLKFFVERIATGCLMTYHEAEKIIKKKGITALLTSSFPFGFDSSFSQAAHNLKIPVISWQHGGSGAFYHPIVNYLDLMSPDIYLTFGQGIIKDQLIDAHKFDTTLVALGSPALEIYYKENFNSEVKADKQTVLYITSHLNQNKTYISANPPHSDNLFWLTQKAIIDLLGKHDSYDIIIKLHPSLEYREPILRYLRDSDFQNIRTVKTETPLRELLKSSDIIILDLPTTTLAQSLTTKKPVFVLTKHLFFNEEAMDILKKRAYCFDDLNEFIKKTHDFLSERDIGEIDYENTEFLENYGMHKLDGKACQRAAAIVKTAVKQCEKRI